LSFWIRHFIVFHGKRHPRDLGEAEVSAFVSRLGTRGVMGLAVFPAARFYVDAETGERRRR
jgi:hypothetical protein